MVFVLDASVSMSWCFDDQVTPYTESILDLLDTTEALVPSLWPIEVSNVLLVGLTQGRIDQSRLIDIVRSFRSLPIRIEPVSLTQAFGPVLSLAQNQGLTAYDASYVELALREGLPLATRDAKMREAARRLGVTLL